MAIDPRLLISALNDLQDESSRWLSSTRDSLAEAEAVQRQALEVARETARYVRITQDAAEQQREQVLDATTHTDALIGRTQDAHSKATHTVQQSRQAHTIAQHTLHHWELELEKALKWLAEAEAWLERAIYEYQMARAELASAESDLRYAQNRLAACQNDKERRNCSSEAAAVWAAQSRVASAANRVRQAEAEVRAAQAEVERATARVKCCTSAVNYATESIELAKRAVQDAGDALIEAERSVEYGQAADRMIKAARTHNEQQLTCAAEAIDHARTCEQHTEEADQQYRHADDASVEAQQLLQGSQFELSQRVDHLAALDRADLFDKVHGGSDGRSSGHAGGQSSARAWRNTGVKQVALDSINVSDSNHVQSEEDFHKVSYDEMVAGFDKLQHVVQPSVAQGKTGDYFSQLDDQQRLTPANGYRKIYDAFYGQDGIRLNKVGNSYQVVNGYHRLFVARRLGIKNVPATVIAQE